MQVCDKIVHYIEFPKNWTTPDCFIWVTTQDMTPTQISNYPHLKQEGKVMMFREVTKSVKGVVTKMRPDELHHLETIVYPDGKTGPKVVYFGGEGSGLTDFIEQPMNEHLLKIKKEKEEKLRTAYERRAKEEDVALAAAAVL